VSWWSFRLSGAFAIEPFNVQLAAKWSAATCDLSAIKIATPFSLGGVRGRKVIRWVGKQIQLPLTRMLPKQGPRWAEMEVAWDSWHGG